MSADELCAPYSGLAQIMGFVARMRDLGLSPEDVLRLYDEWMAERMVDMVPAAEAPGFAAPPDPDVRRPEGQADTEHRLGACPKCGAEVWGIRKCPHVSPPWRTFLACDNPDCAYHGKSRLTVDELRRVWPVGVEED